MHDLYSLHAGTTTPFANGPVATSNGLLVHARGWPMRGTLVKHSTASSSFRPQSLVEEDQDRQPTSTAVDSLLPPGITLS